jgi:AcrR family transcriptional regulator
MTRADARRNRARILAAAEEVVDREGFDASLEEIARLAGVGSATLYRHFPTRGELLEAVFHDRVVTLCEKAAASANDPDPVSALSVFVHALGSYVVSTNGLASVLAATAAAPDAGDLDGESCFRMMSEAGAPLLRGAQDAGRAAPETTIDEVIALVISIALTAEYSGKPAVSTTRLIDLSFAGICP